MKTNVYHRSATSTGEWLGTPDRNFVAIAAMFPSKGDFHFAAKRFNGAPSLARACLRS
jgi:hypothetical protein